MLILEQECKLFEKILDELKPDFIIMTITNVHHDHLFYKICQARGVKILILWQSNLRGRYTISSRIDLIDHAEYNEKHNLSLCFLHIQNNKIKIFTNSS